MMTDDMELVREYVARQSETAFETLVSRHINLVYSSALRQVHDAQLAEEITQAVFIILSRKAGSLGLNTVLSAWLYRTTRYASADALKSQRRRQRREQEAHMQSKILNEQTDPAWKQLSPLLDEAMARLGERDRSALVLRFFENKTAREIAAVQRVDESAAQKRISRALDKLRSFFHKRGITLSAMAIVGAVSANSVHAAPGGLAVTVTAAAVKGAVVSGSTLSLIEGALKIMAWTKAKTAVVAGAVLILAAGTTTVIVKKSDHHSRAKLQWTPAEKQIFEAETARRINQAKISVLACSHFADEHQDQWPTTFAQLKAQHPEVRLSDSNWEFVSGGNRSSFTNPAQTILFREKESRQSPDGNFVRLYAFADWSVQVLNSPDDDFAALEKQGGFLIQPVKN